MLGTYSRRCFGENPVIAVISDARRHRRPTGIRNTNARARRLSEADVEKLALAYRAGDSTYALARRFGIHRHTIAEHLRRHGIPLRRTGPLN